jgi:hypothetical protein
MKIHVSTAEPFAVVRDAFIRFMQQHTDELGAGMHGQTNHLFLSATTGGHSIYLSFFISWVSMESNKDLLKMVDSILEWTHFRLLAWNGICDDKRGVGVPAAYYNLPTLFQFVSGTLLLTLHCAMADVKATATVLHSPIFWDTRTECIFRLSTSQDQQQQGSPIANSPPEQLYDGLDSESGDSESSQSGVQSVSYSSSTSSEDEDITGTVPLGDTWEKDCDFQPA